MKKSKPKIESYSPTARKAIESIARARGVTADEVLATFERLYAGKGPRKGARPIFAVEADATASATTCDGCATCGQRADGTLTITLTGRVAENLRRAADAMNSVSWTGGGITAAFVLAEFVCRDALDGWGDRPPHCELGCLHDATGGIVAAVDTGADGDAELDAERKRELGDAFRRAFDFQPLAAFKRKRRSHAAEPRPAFKA